MRNLEVVRNLPQLSWSLTGATAPFSLQSIESGTSPPRRDWNRLLLVLFLLEPAANLVPKYLDRYSSLVRSANAVKPNWYGKFWELISSMYLRLSLKISNRLSRPPLKPLCNFPCSARHSSYSAITSSSVLSASEMIEEGSADDTVIIAKKRTAIIGEDRYVPISIIRPGSSFRDEWWCFQKRGSVEESGRGDDFIYTN